MQKLLSFERLMQATGSRWFLNIFLAIILFCNSETGRIFGIEGLPLKISPVWPTTGFALAALLLFGTKTWPGIFIGNFCYNFYHLFSSGPITLGPTIVAFSVTIGSLLQALVGNWVMKKYASPGFFGTAKDVFIFLLGGGIATCMIASSIGVFALHMYGVVIPEDVGITWLTFWMGDTMGVYIFTPLLVVWSLYMPLISVKAHPKETVCLLASFLLATLVISERLIAPGYLFIPLAIWASYRFGMHGATLSVAYIALVRLVPAALGYEPLLFVFVGNPVLVFVSVLLMVSALSLIIAALVNERQAALSLIEERTLDFQKSVSRYLVEAGKEEFLKKMRSSLGTLTSSITKQMQVPLKLIHTNVISAIDCFSRIKKGYQKYKETLDPDLSFTLESNLVPLEKSLNDIVKFEKHAKNIAHVIEGHSARTVNGGLQAQDIHINMFLIDCLQEVAKKESKLHPDFTFTVIEEFDKVTEPIVGLPEDLAHAFSSFFENAIHSMKKKKDQKGENYLPMLQIRTFDHDDTIEVIIKDNGLGVSQENLTKFSESFVSPERPEEATNLGLPLAHDIIVLIHHGDLEVDSKEGEFLQLRIQLQKMKKLSYV